MIEKQLRFSVILSRRHLDGSEGGKQAGTFLLRNYAKHCETIEVGAEKPMPKALFIHYPCQKHSSLFAAIIWYLQYWTLLMLSWYGKRPTVQDHAPSETTQQSAYRSKETFAVRIQVDNRHPHLRTCDMCVRGINRKTINRRTQDKLSCHRSFLRNVEWLSTSSQTPPNSQARTLSTLHPALAQAGLSFSIYQWEWMISSESSCFFHFFNPIQRFAVNLEAAV